MEGGLLQELRLNGRSMHKEWQQSNSWILMSNYRNPSRVSSFAGCLSAVCGAELREWEKWNNEQNNLYNEPGKTDKSEKSNYTLQHKSEKKYITFLKKKHSKQN